jgi:hypothetical protein
VKVVFWTAVALANDSRSVMPRTKSFETSSAGNAHGVTLQDLFQLVVIVDPLPRMKRLAPVKERASR